MPEVVGTPYEVDPAIGPTIEDMANRVSKMRIAGRLSPEVLGRLRRFFRIKNIYNSNAIEGNQLDIGETRLVVEKGMTITGKPLKDQAEAKNLSEALDFLEQLATDRQRPITEADIRQLHFLVLKNIRDADAGRYRTQPVEISGSAFKPPPPESVSLQMQEFGRWLSNASIGERGEIDPLLIAAAAHTWFVTIHPFVDGNGRVARLLLNLILMRHGYPIAVVTKADRKRYYDALEASQTSDLTAVASLFAECVDESLEEYESAAEEQRENQEWAQSIASKFEHSHKVRAANEYEVWRNAMELLKSVFRQTSELVDSSASLGKIWFTDFGILEFEKYLALKTRASAKRTWFFRIDFKSGAKTTRYLYFFGSASPAMRLRADVSLFLAREEPVGSFNYERLDYISAPNVPELREIGYDAKGEDFVVRKISGRIMEQKIDNICRDVFEDIMSRHFA